MNRALGLKLFFIAIITGVILIALVLVNDTISDRQKYRDDAVTSIADSYAGAQTLVGPVLVQPYTQEYSTAEIDADGKPKVTTGHREASEVTFPEKFAFTGKLVPSERRHGLYRAAVYVLDAHLSGSIDAPDSNIDGKVTYGEPYLAFVLSDVRGIIGMPAVRINGTPMTIAQGGVISGVIEELSTEPHDRDSLGGSFSASPSDSKVNTVKKWQPNLRVRLTGAQPGKKGHYDFDMNMQLAGTQRLSLGPIGDINDISLASTWPSPLFAGRFLPRAPQVGPSGFNAAWSLSSLAAATQQQIVTGQGDVDTLNVSLLTPIDPYKLSDRATKYGILFVILTFGGFFLYEMMKQLPIHPVQYLLVGFGLAIFFLLLVSFSEHMPFARAYVIASAACIGLLAFYLSYVLHSYTRGLAFGAMLATLYATVYGLLISEDNALILGSLMLFAVLAAVMVVTRKVDWYRNSAMVPKPAPPPLAGLGL